MKRWSKIKSRIHAGPSARGERGFSLTELLIVSAILAILSALAIPQYRGYVRRSKSQTAVKCLTELMTAMAAYRVDEGRYADKIDSLADYRIEEDCDIENSASSEKYTLKVLSTGTTAFKAEARGKLTGQTIDDVWTITENGKLSHTKDGT